MTKTNTETDFTVTRRREIDTGDLRKSLSCDTTIEQETMRGYSTETRESDSSYRSSGAKKRQSSKQNLRIYDRTRASKRDYQNDRSKDRALGSLTE